MKGHMKGNLLETAIPYVFGIVFVGMLLGAGAIALGTGGMSVGYNSSTTPGQAMSNASSSLVNMAVQLPTTGTIAGVALIIMVLFVAVGAYVFGRRE